MKQVILSPGQAVWIKMKPNVKLLLILCVIGLLSVYLRLYFVYEINFFNRSDAIEEIGGDSFDYLHLARNIAHNGIYSQATIESRWYALFRTPGYPLFCAMFEYFGFGAKGIIVGQAVLGAFIPIIVTFLVYLLLGSHFWAFLGGLISALSPTGIGLTGVILTDLLFSVFFLFGFLLFLTGILRSNIKFIFVSGVIWGVSLLIKPVLTFWPIITLCIFYLLKKAFSSPMAWRYLFVHLMIQTVFMSGWYARNYVSEGLFTMSPVLQNNLRIHLATEVEAIAKGYGSERISEATLWLRKGVSERDDKDIQRGVPFSSIYKRQSDECKAIFMNYPLLTIKIYFLNVMEHVNSSWDHLFRQYPFYARWTAMFRFMSFSISLIALLKKYFYIFILIVSVLALIPFKNSSRQELRCQLYISTVFLLTFLYFAASTGTVFWGGSRLTYPAEFSLIILFVFNFHIVIKRVKIWFDGSFGKKRRRANIISNSCSLVDAKKYLLEVM